MTKEIFTEAVESMRNMTWVQQNSNYNNDKSIKIILKLLHLHFPREKDGYCPIEHFCFYLDFGKMGGAEIQTLDNLWGTLTEKE